MHFLQPPSISIKDKEIDMIDIGVYVTRGDKRYACEFLREENLARAIGPLPKDDQVGSRDIAFEVRAASEQEARRKLGEAIGPGTWC